MTSLIVTDTYLLESCLGKGHEFREGDKCGGHEAVVQVLEAHSVTS